MATPICVLAVVALDDVPGEAVPVPVAGQVAAWFRPDGTLCVKTADGTEFAGKPGVGAGGGGGGGTGAASNVPDVTSRNQIPVGLLSDGQGLWSLLNPPAFDGRFFLEVLDGQMQWLSLADLLALVPASGGGGGGGGGGVTYTYGPLQEVVGTPIFSSTYADPYGILNVFDHNQSTRGLTSAVESNEYAGVDLGAGVKALLSKVRIYPTDSPDGTDRSTGMHVEQSQDGQTWVNIGTTINAQAGVWMENPVSATEPARLFRVRKDGTIPLDLQSLEFWGKLVTATASAQQGVPQTVGQ